MISSNCILILLVYFVVGFDHVSAFLNFVINNEEKMNVSQMIRHWGYPVEEHDVLTSDGYILGVQRIPYGRNDNVTFKATRPVVFLQHGLLGASTNWVANLPQQSLGFILADAGFDVWLGNVRGNTYSKKHLTATTSSEKYWDFSWDEMAKYDLPAMIDYALQTTKQKQLFYVGHSQGTAIGFAGFSENPSLAKKVKLFVALAPVARIDSCKSPVRFVAYFSKGLEFFFDIFGLKEFLPSSRYMRFLAEDACPFDEPICTNLMFILMGPDTKNLNQSRIPTYLSHCPAGTSVRNILHYSQMYMAQKFQAYDYGYFKNVLKYGSFSPKVYDIKKMTTPVLAVSGGRDWLADTKDVSWLLRRVQSAASHLHLKDYNHLDFIWGIDAAKDVYNHILKAFRKFD